MTDATEVEKLVERLREPLVSFNARIDTAGNRYHPDMLEAADLIEAQAAEIARLDAECERAWSAYRIAHDQAMANGEAALAAPE